MTPLEDVDPGSSSLISSYPVMLDGKVIGYLHKKNARDVVDKLRIIKIREDDQR